MTVVLTPDAHLVVMQGFEHALRLGHRHLGGEHFLLALAAVDQPAGAALRDRGVTLERVEAEIVRLAGRGLFRDLFGDLDRDALAAIGIDVDAVRGKIEASFGRDALSRAARTAHREPNRFSLRSRTGAWRGDGAFLPHGPGATQSLINARQEARAVHAARAGVAHFALGILAIDEGLVPAILSGLGVSGPALRVAVLGQYRQAG